MFCKDVDFASELERGQGVPISEGGELLEEEVIAMRISLGYLMPCFKGWMGGIFLGGDGGYLNRRSAFRAARGSSSMA